MPARRPGAFRALSVCVLRCALSGSASVINDEREDLWQYAPSDGCAGGTEGKCGPNEWETIPGFEGCAQQGAQSPIDMQLNKVQTLPDQGFTMAQQGVCTGSVSYELNEHTMEVEFKPSCADTFYAMFRGEKYELLQFHFHSPSENQWDGGHFPMEAHYVHRRVDGDTSQYLVLAVMIAVAKQGTSDFLLEILDNIPHAVPDGGTNWHDREAPLGSINPYDFLPASTGFKQYIFQGSMTTPPCQPGHVHWVMATEPVSVTERAVHKYRKVINANPDNQLSPYGVIVGLEPDAVPPWNPEAGRMAWDAELGANNRPVQPLKADDDLWGREVFMVGISTISIFHKLVFVLLFYLVCIGAWRWVSFKHSVQSCLHRLWLPFRIIFQWYCLLWFVFLGLFADVFAQIVISVRTNSHNLEPGMIKQHLVDKVASGYLAPQQVDNLMMPAWMRIFSLVSVLVGGLSLAIIAVHVFKIIRRGSRYNANSQFPWMIRGRQDMLFLLVVMPSVFIIMSMRSTSRMWMVMTAEHTGADAATDMALFKENFELAEVCQYYVVFVFSQLCISFLNEQEASQDMKTAIKYVGFQGVYVWCLIGSVHSVILFGLAYSHNFNLAPATMLKLQDIEAKAGLLASAMSLLCTYNMLVICKLPYMQTALNNASMKFNGTKVLLLLGPNQLKVLLALTKFPILSEERAMLLHSSLISIECLLVAALNFFAWEIQGGKDKFFDEREEAKDGYRQLNT